MQSGEELVIVVDVWWDSFIFVFHGFFLICAVVLLVPALFVGLLVFLVIFHGRRV